MNKDNIIMNKTIQLMKKRISKNSIFVGLALHR